jgi:AcrR family transcriptional regulator
MGVSERRDREKKEMRDVILKAAMALFIEKGYDDVSIRNIADKIEYSPASVYNYFRDKDDILFTLHNIAFGRFYAALSESSEITDALERLHTLGKKYIEFALRNPEYYDLMFIMKAPMKKVECADDWEAGLNAHKILEETVKECIEKGYIDSNSPEAVVYAMWSFVHGLVSLVIRKRAVMIPEEYIEPLLKQAHEFIFKSISTAEVK